MGTYFKIGEISNLYHIGTDSLRYYEKKGILKPKRGHNSYRYYQMEDIWRLNVIRELRDLGFSMEKISAYLEHHTVQGTEYLLKEELYAIKEKVEYLLELKENVEERLKVFEESREQTLGKIRVIQLPDRHFYETKKGYHSDEEMDVLMKQLLNQNPEKLYIIGNNRIGSVILLDSAKEGKCRAYENVFMIAENGTKRLPGGTYLSVSYSGNCEQNYQYVPLLLSFARENGYKITSDIYELLWIDIHVSEKEEEHITELQVRVE